VIDLQGSSATRARITEEFSKLAAAGPHELFVLFFAGHGYTTRHGGVSSAVPPAISELIPTNHFGCYSGS
jgi:hypothetical protein